MKVLRKSIPAALLVVTFNAGGLAHAAEATTRNPLLAEAEFPAPKRNATPGYDHLGVGASVETTDNATRVEQDPRSDTLLSALASFGLVLPERRRLHAQIDGDVVYQEYTRDSYDSELIASASGDASYDLIDDHLTWVLRDDLTQGRVDQTATETAANRQNVNFAMTGLDFGTLIGDHNLLRVDAHYELADYEVSLEDSSVTLGRVAFIREIGKHQALRASVTARDVRYVRDALFPDYSGTDYSLAWAASGAFTDLTLEAGYTTIDLSGNETKEPMYRAQLGRELTPRSRIDILLSHELTGTSDAIHFDQTLGGRGPRTSEVAVNPDPFVFEFAGISYQFQGPRLELLFNVSTSRDRYSTSIIDDRDRTEASVDLDLAKSARWKFGVFAQYVDETFIERDNSSSKYKDYGVYTSVAVGARTRVQVSVGRSERETDFVGGGYEENIARVSLLHSFGRGNPGAMMDAGSVRR